MNEIASRLAARLFDTPIIENQYRSAFVEAMIEPYLAERGWRYVGAGWSGWDFEHEDGTRLEVKQSAAQQTWSGTLGTRTRGAFDIATRRGYFDQGGSRWNATPGRCAHVYVFAWNAHYGAEVDHRKPEQWEFYVIPTLLLPSNQKSISLSRIKAIAVTGARGPVSLDELASHVARASCEVRSGRRKE